MKIQIDRGKYYRLKERRTGIPLHAAQRFLHKYNYGQVPLTNRAPIIHIIMKNAFMINDNNKYKQWINIFEISLNLIFGASKKNTEKFDYIFDIMTRELVHFEANLHINYEKMKNLIQERINMREKYRTLIKFYTDLYEGYYKCIVSIFAISKMILNNKNIPENIQAYIHEDPYTKIEELEKDDQNGCILPLPELTKNCNRNLRNGICHEHWKIVDNTIEIWDWNKRKNKEVWRGKYTLDTLKAEIDVLQETVEAMALAIILHSLSRYRNINGFLSIAPGNYDLSFLEDAMENAAFDFGLLLNDCEINESGDILTIVLCVPDNLDLEQVSQIIEGSNPPMFYKTPLCIIENSVRDMVLNFLLIAAGPMQSYSNVNIIVSDEKKGQIGDFNIKASELNDFSKGNRSHVEEMFNILQPYIVKITKEGPSMPDYPWDPIKDEELLATWKKMNSVKLN